VNRLGEKGRVRECMYWTYMCTRTRRKIVRESETRECNHRRSGSTEDEVRINRQCSVIQFRRSVPLIVLNAITMAAISSSSVLQRRFETAVVFTFIYGFAFRLRGRNVVDDNDDGDDDGILSLR